MAVSYYNPNQQTTQAGKNYQGTQNWYRQQEQTPMDNPGIRHGADGYNKGQGTVDSSGKPTFSPAAPAGFKSAQWSGPKSATSGLADALNGTTPAPMGSATAGLVDSMNGYSPRMYQAKAPTAPVRYNQTANPTQAARGTSSPFADLSAALNGTPTVDKQTTPDPGQYDDLPVQIPQQGDPYVDESQKGRFNALTDAQKMQNANDVQLAGVSPTDSEDYAASFLQNKSMSDYLVASKAYQEGKMTFDDMVQKYGNGIALWVARDAVAHPEVAPTDPNKNFFDIPEVTVTRPYQEYLDELMASINTDYSNQEAHALSQNENAKQAALNDMMSALGATGMGESPIGLNPAAGSILSDYGDKSASIVADLQKQQTEDKQNLLATVGQMSASERADYLKAAIENANNALKEDQNERDKGSIDIQTRQGIADAFAQATSNWETLMGQGKLSDAEKGALADAFKAFSDAQAAGADMDLLQRLYLDLVAQLQPLMIKYHPDGSTD